MTENKRFKAIGKEIWQDNRIWCVCGGEHCADVIATAMNELLEEKEFWKSNCCSQSNFNQILLNELDIAQEQGYEVSNPFKKLMGKKED